MTTLEEQPTDADPALEQPAEQPYDNHQAAHAIMGDLASWRTGVQVKPVMPDEFSD